jgi:hypothetical protein
MHPARWCHRARVQHARLRMVIAKYEGLEAYIPMLGEAGFAGLSDLYDCPAAELERLAAQMKVPHAKLLRRLHASLLPSQGGEWASFVASRERTTQDLCRACSLSECAPRFIDEGYDFAFYFSEAGDAELEELLALLQPVECRRLLRVIGRPVALSRVVAEQAEEPPLDAFWVQPAAADEAFPASQGRTVRSLANMMDPPLTSLPSFHCACCVCFRIGCAVRAKKTSPRAHPTHAGHRLGAAAIVCRFRTTWSSCCGRTRAWNNTCPSLPPRV